jgi:pimeloyl-ACP methyl ester carboxylesterase
MRRHWKLILGIALATVLALGAVGFVWLTDLVDPMPEASAAVESEDGVTVSEDPWLAFTPTEPAGTGFIFYPGGRVPHEAYAPSARAIAADGYLSVVPAMPFGLAVLAPDTADDIIAAYPEIERWVIGGHSLGGVMAAEYALDNEPVEGLALWASYPQDGTDLTDSGLRVTSIYATEDGLTTLEDIEASREQLPPDTVFVEIEGGNHAGFGWYGEQDGDGVATISREEQQAQVVAATLELLASVEAG